MAVIITKKPAAFVLAGNPALLTVSSQLKDKRFLKVHASVTVRLFQEGVLKKTASTELSVPTVGGGEAVVFNLSSPLKAVLQQRQVNPLRGQEAGRQAGGYARLEVKVWDTYVDDSNTVISSPQVDGGGCLAVAGAYSDIQRIWGREDTSLTFTDGTIMSNRPSGLIQPAGCPWVLPVLRVSASLDLDPLERVVSVLDDKGAKVLDVKVKGQPNEVEQVLMDQGWKDLPPGNYSVGGIGVTLVTPDPRAVYFEFVNSLGALESLVCFAWTKEKYKLEFERNLRHQPYSFRPAARWVKHMSSQEYVVSLSTGPVSRRQAGWIVQEFFASEQCWMFDDELDMMVPVVIESDNGTLYDFTGTKVIDLDFEVVRSWNGTRTDGFFSRKGF